MEELEKLDDKKIVVNLKEGQNAVTILEGQAPKQLDELEPVKAEIHGVIYAPLNWLDKRVKDIDQHKAYILVNRDALRIHLIVNEDDPYRIGNIVGTINYSDIFMKLGINSDKSWQPEALGQFFKLYRSLFPNRSENMNVVTALKSFNAKVSQDVERLTNEKGDRSSPSSRVVLQ